MMKIGYIRSEKKDDAFYKEQKNILQECERVFEDSGDNAIGLEHMLDYMRAEDKIHVYQLDRFGLNIRDVIALIHDFLSKGIHIMSMHDNIDTSTQEGRTLLKIFNVLNMCEQNSISASASFMQSPIKKESIVMAPSSLSLGQLMGGPSSHSSHPSISSTSSNSVYSSEQMNKNNITSIVANSSDFLRNPGRPKGLTPQAKEKAETAAAMYQDGSMSMRDIAQNLNISTATLYSYLRHEKVI